jgi:hypothetical protein
MGQHGKYQKQECGNPDQKIGRQLWGVNFLLVHGTSMLSASKAFRN